MTNSKQTEAMKLALEALEGIWDDGLEGYPVSFHRNAITALRESLTSVPDWASEAKEQPAPMIRGDIRDGLVDDEPAHQHIEHCLWARNGNQPCPHVQPAQQNAVAWESDRGEIYYDKEDAFRYSDGFIRPLVYGDTPQAQPAQQEPVAWMVYAKDGLSVYVTDNPTGISEGQRALPLYTSPPASKSWVGLTEFDIDQIPYSCSHADSRLIACAIEAKLKEKNT